MKFLKWIIAAGVGAMAGFGYWYFIGCNSGSCAITSSPINSSMYGALMGILLLNLVTDNSKNSSKEKGS
jgi:hypothetical protein